MLDNGETGITLDVSTLTCLRDNCVRGNLGNGIVVQGRGRLRENDVIGNGKSGVVILGPGDPFVAKNRIISADATAIEVLADARGCVSENEVYSKTGKNIVQDLSSTTIVENNDVLASLDGDVRNDDLVRRPLQTGNAIPRNDISHIVRKLTMPQTQKNGAKLTTSRFCVLL